MNTIAEIQQAILALSETEFAQLSRRLHERDWEQRDSQIEADTQSGKLDFLAEQAAKAKACSTLREL